MALLLRLAVGTAAAPAGVDRAALLSDLRVLSADDMQGRELGTAGGERARAFIARRFADVGVQPFGTTYLEPFPFAVGSGASVRRGTGVNVVGRIDGTADAADFIVVSAHYDHLGVKNGQVFNGADDNASGTAALFAIAAYFRTHRPAHSVLFAAFDGEEEDLLGSEAFVKTPPVPLRSIGIDLNADMIGRDPNDTLFVVGTYRQPFLKPFIDDLAKTASVKLLIGHDNPAERGVEDWTEDSDHFAFMQAGVPALYFGVEDFAQHHQPTDDYETMTYDFYVNAVTTLISAVQEFDARFDAVRTAAARAR